MLAANPDVEIVEHSMRSAGEDDGREAGTPDQGPGQAPGLRSEADNPQGGGNPGSAPNLSDVQNTSAPMGVDPNAAMLTGGAQAAERVASKPEPEEPDEPMGPRLHDVTIAIRKTYGCAKVMPVPPEEFGITRHTRTIAEAGYCFHEIPRTVGIRLDQGYDAAALDKLPTFINPLNMYTLSRA